MTLTSLINTSWLLNDNPTSTFPFTHYINFDSGNGYMYQALQMESISGGVKQLSIYADKDDPTTKLVIYRSDSGWVNDNYKEILDISGGADAEHLGLIDWLENNATLTSVTIGVPQPQVANGVISWDEIANASSYIIYKVVSEQEQVYVEITTTSYNLTESGEYRVQAKNDNFFGTTSYSVYYDIKNILMHPRTNGVLEENIDLYPKTLFENIKDIPDHIINEVLEDSDDLVTSAGIFNAIQAVPKEITYINNAYSVQFDDIKALRDENILPIIVDTTLKMNYYLVYESETSYVFVSVFRSTLAGEPTTYYTTSYYWYYGKNEGQQYRNHSSYTSEALSNKVTTINNLSTNTQYPSAKAVYDYVSSINSAAWGHITGTLSDQTDLQNALNDKVDKEIGKGLSSNDFTTTEKNKLAGIESGAEVNVLEGVKINNNDLTITNKKVNIVMDTTFNPSSTNAAQSQAIANFVNSSISSNTAYFLGTYNLVSDLSGSISDTHNVVANEIETYFQNHPPVGGISNNDYVFIQIPTANNTPTIIAQIDRYKYNSEDEEWLYEYTLNNSGFTAAQWAAINSGIDATKVNSYDGYETTKQDTLVSGTNIKTINGNSILGSGNITTYAEFVDTWVTTLSSTVLAFCQQVNGTTSAVVGTAYLGSVSFSDMPTGVSNGELVVEIIPSSAATNGKAIHLILTSGSINPYRWEYTYWEQNSTDHYTGWIGFQNKLTAGNNISIAGNTISAVSSSTNKFVTAAMYSWLQDQLYQAPAISLFKLYYNNNLVGSTFERGTQVTFNKIKHQETNISNISSLTLTGGGLNVSVTPSNTATIIDLSEAITVNSNTAFVLTCVNTKNVSITSTIGINFYDYAYSALTSSTTAPTSSLTKHGTVSVFKSNGAEISYETGKYLYFYTTYSNATTIETYVLGTWASAPTTVIGEVTITKENGTTGTYYCFRTTSPFSANGSAKYRVV